MSSNKNFSIITILSIIGILLSIYLLVEQIFRPPFQPCNINSYINCNAVISGEVSKTLGIPTPLYGFIGYIVIFLSSVYKKKEPLLATATFGLVFCLWIAFRELVQLHVICPVCIGCQLVMISVFTLSVLLIKSPKKNI